MIRATLLLAAALALPVMAAPGAPRTTVHGETRDEIPDVNLFATVAAAQAQAGDDDGGLPTTWCGDAITSDDGAHAVFPAAQAQIKVVYAYAADRPNRFAVWADALQANVAVAERFLSAQDGGTKALRFDMGTGCGRQYVDIQIVPLPGPAAQYADQFRPVAAAVQDALDATGPLNAIVLADQMGAQGVDHGLAETITGESGERPGPANPHNGGGLSGVLFTRDGAEAPGPGARGWWPEGFLHEITHTLGAVQWGAPHSTQPQGQQDPRFGHCWQGADVMCYVENPSAAHPLQMDCAPVAGTITTSYDCGRDDYFSPAPAPGSYLATHWNTYDSAFMGACGDIAPACGGGELWTPAPPTAASGPKVEGKTRRGATLRADPGAWINRPSSFEYRWQRLNGRSWRDIDDADGARYVPTSSDLGRRLRVLVKAINDDGVTAAASAPTGQIGAVAVKKTARARSGDADREHGRKAGRR